MQKINLKKAAREFSKMVHLSCYNDERFILCKNNKPMTVMLSWDDWQIIEERFREEEEKKELKE